MTEKIDKEKNKSVDKKTVSGQTASSAGAGNSVAKGKEEPVARQAQVAKESKISGESKVAKKGSTPKKSTKPKEVLRPKGKVVAEQKVFVAKKIKTFSLKPQEVKKTWVLIDAKDLVLGRLATQVAKILRGKTKATYTPHVDCGDNVIIVNAKHVHLTGKKRQDKVYRWHTGYPGGLKSKTATEILEGNFPERVVKKSIERMLPKGPLARKQMQNLRVYAGAEHKHKTQNPVLIDLASKNVKNVKRR